MALSALCLMLALISSIAEETSSPAEACSVVPCESSWAVALTWPEPLATSLAEAWMDPIFA